MRKNSVDNAKDYQDILPDLLKEYVEEFPHRLAEIEILWYKLRHDKWDQNECTKLHRLLFNIVGSGGSLGLHFLSETAKKIATALGEMKAHPSATEEALVNQYIDELHLAVEKNELTQKTDRKAVTRKLLQELNTKKREAEEYAEKLKTRVQELETKIETTKGLHGQNEFAEGTVLPGSAGETYKVQQMISEGGMGIIYEAIRTSDHQKVLVKTMFQDTLADAKISMRFLQEAKAILEFDHPNLVHGYDFYQEKKLCYLVMELIEGETVKDILNRLGFLEPLLATQIVLDIAQGLSYLEEKHLVHRDIKPANIILASTGVARLVDFGLVKMSDKQCALTTAGIVIGTPHYLSPEQLCEDKVDTRSDIYSLGATYYHMVVGQEPFQGENQIQVLQQRLVRTPSPKKVKSNLPKEVCRIIEKMMQINIEKRYKTTKDLICDLTALFEKLYKQNSQGLSE